MKSEMHERKVEIEKIVKKDEQLFWRAATFMNMTC